MMKFLKNKKGAGAVEAIFLIFALIAVSVGGLYILNDDGSYELEKVEDFEIISLQDNVSTSGNMVLGSGYIGSEMNYYFMAEKDGGFNQHNIKSSESTIYYLKDENEKSHIEKYKVVYESKISRIIKDDEYQYKIYIPEGSIIEEINVDLK